jgi:hypothetical protein
VILVARAFTDGASLPLIDPQLPQLFELVIELVVVEQLAL